MGFANKISLSRILAIPFLIAGLFLYANHHDLPVFRWAILFIFSFAMLTDLVDGAIARIKKEKTPLGKVLDPLADKLLLLNAFIWIYTLRGQLPFTYLLPLWVVMIVISRDVIILLGLLILYLLKIEVEITPNIWGKLTTFFQMFTILSLFLNLFLTPYLWTLACVFTVISGVLYVKRGVSALNAFDSKNSHS